MPIIANTTSANTFSAVRSQLNLVTRRVNQFSINESAFYANTITANVAFRVSGTLLANSTAGTSGYYLRTSGTGVYWSPVSTVNQYLQVANAVATYVTKVNPTTSGIFAHTGRATISTNLGVSGNTTLGSLATITTANAVFSGSTANPLVRITQTGAGHALLVEDSTNPDSTPFVIDASGRVIAGHTAYSGMWYTNSNVPTVFSITNTTNRGGFGNINYQGPAGLSLMRASGGVIGTDGIVTNADRLGVITFAGADGGTAGYIPAAQVFAEVDGTPGLTDMPGRLIFATTADAASAPTERMRIDNAGRVGIGGTAASNHRVLLGGSQTLGTDPQVFLNQQTIQSGATSTATYFDTYANLQATSFNTSLVTHYRATQGALSGGATITDQRGFTAENSLTGATLNRGFLGNIAAGTGRWNFYAGGTADNYFAGNVGVGVTTPTAKINVVESGTQDAVRITNTGSGNSFVVEDEANPDASPFVISASGIVGVGESSPGTYVSAGMALKSSIAFCPTISIWNTTNDGSFTQINTRKDRAGAIVQNGDTIFSLRTSGYDGAAYRAMGDISFNVDGVPGASDMPGRITFSTTADGAATSTERMRIDSVGRIGIGNTAPLHKLSVNGTTFLKANTTLNAALIANGSPGTSGHYLRTSGSGVYWSPASGGGSSSNNFSGILVGSNVVVADSSTDRLTIVAGSGISIAANPTTDTITFSSTASAAFNYGTAYALRSISF